MRITKGLLHTGDVVQLNSGENFIVMLNTGYNHSRNTNILFSPNDRKIILLDDYDDNLNYKNYSKSYDINKIYISNDFIVIAWDIYQGDNPLWTFERINNTWKKTFE